MLKVLYNHKPEYSILIGFHWILEIHVLQYWKHNHIMKNVSHNTGKSLKV